MPKLMILAVCEKFIIDRAELPSLISIFQNLDLQLTGEPMPEKAVTPLKWSVFTMWQHAPEERDVEFVQHLEVITPKGEQFVTGTTSFRVTGPRDLQSKIGSEFQMMPVSDEGFITVRVWLEGAPDNASEYKFTITHVHAPMVPKAEDQVPVG
jgi:hypothetical protein